MVIEEVLQMKLSVNWFTPDKYLDAVRECLGGIDVDPATNERGQLRVKAKKFYTPANSGLDKSWNGTVMLCPPYTPVSLMAEFIDKLISEYRTGNTTAAVCFLPTNTTWEEWWQNGIKEAKAVCFINELIHWYPGHLPELLWAKELGISMENVPKYDTRGTVVLYFGKDIVKFKDVFSKFGLILYGQ